MCRLSGRGGRAQGTRPVGQVRCSRCLWPGCAAALAAANCLSWGKSVSWQTCCLHRQQINCRHSACQVACPSLPGMFLACRWASVKDFLGSWRRAGPSEVPLPADKLKCHLPSGGAPLPPPQHARPAVPATCLHLTWWWETSWVARCVTGHPSAPAAAPVSSLSHTHTHTHTHTLTHPCCVQGMTWSGTAP